MYTECRGGSVTGSSITVQRSAPLYIWRSSYFLQVIFAWVKKCIPKQQLEVIERGKKTERKETWIIFITCGSCFDQMENILIHAHLSTSRKSGSDSNSWPLLAFLCFPSLGAKLLDFLGQETSLCEPFTDSDDSHPKAMSVSSGAEAPTWPP